MTDGRVGEGRVVFGVAVSLTRGLTDNVGRGDLGITRTGLAALIMGQIGPRFSDPDPMARGTSEPGSATGRRWTAENHSWDAYRRGAFDDHMDAVLTVGPDLTTLSSDEAREVRRWLGGPVPASWRMKLDGGSRELEGFPFFGLNWDFAGAGVEGWNPSAGFAKNAYLLSGLPLEPAWFTRGIGPHGEYLLRTLPVGLFSTRKDDGYPFDKDSEQGLWESMIVGRPLDVACRNGAFDDMDESPDVLEFALTLPFVAASALAAQVGTGETNAAGAGGAAGTGAACQLVERFANATVFSKRGRQLTDELGPGEQGDRPDQPGEQGDRPDQPDGQGGQSDQPARAYVFTADQRAAIMGMGWPDDVLAAAQVVSRALVRYILAPQAAGGLFRAVCECLGMRSDDPYLAAVAAWASDLRERGTRRGGAAIAYADVYTRPTYLGDDPIAWLEDVGASAEPGLLASAESGAGKSTMARGLAALVASLRQALVSGWLDQVLGDADLSTMAEGPRAIAAFVRAFVPPQLRPQAGRLARYVPVFVTQPEWDTDKTSFARIEQASSLDEFLFDSPARRPVGQDTAEVFTAGKPGRDAFNALASSGRCLLIVDSIDEVPFAHRDAYMGLVQRFCDERGVCRLLLTSRQLPVDQQTELRGLARYHVTEMRPMPEDSSRELFDRMAAIWRRRGLKSLVSFDDLRSEPGFATMLANPMVLTRVSDTAFTSPENLDVYRVLVDVTERMRKYEGGPTDDERYDDEAIGRLAIDMGTPAAGGVDDTYFIRRFAQYRAEASGTRQPMDEAATRDILDTIVSRRGIIAHEQRRIRFVWRPVQACCMARLVVGRFLDTIDEEDTARAAREGLADVDRMMGDAAGVSWENAQDMPASAIAVLLILSCERLPGATQAWDEFRRSVARRAVDGYVYGDEGRRRACAAMISQVRTFEFGKPLDLPEHAQDWMAATTAWTRDGE